MNRGYEVDDPIEEEFDYEMSRMAQTAVQLVKKIVMKIKSVLED